MLGYAKYERNFLVSFPECRPVKAFKLARAQGWYRISLTIQLEDGLLVNK